MSSKSRTFPKWIFLVAAITALLTLLYIFIALNGKTYSSTLEKTPRANLTVVAAISIPTLDNSLLTITPTPTVDSSQTVNGIAARNYVKIQGTSGVGLRIRSAPGLTSETNFIANESEVFIVIGGPRNADDLVWWQLTTPYDENRQGWAAADYLVPIDDL